MKKVIFLVITIVCAFFNLNSMRKESFNLYPAFSNDKNYRYDTRTDYYMFDPSDYRHSRKHPLVLIERYLIKHDLKKDRVENEKEITLNIKKSNDFYPYLITLEKKNNKYVAVTLRSDEATYLRVFSTYNLMLRKTLFFDSEVREVAFSSKDIIAVRLVNRKIKFFRIHGKSKKALLTITHGENEGTPCSPLRILNLIEFNDAGDKFAYVNKRNEVGILRLSDKKTIKRIKVKSGYFIMGLTFKSNDKHLIVDVSKRNFGPPTGQILYFL